MRRLSLVVVVCLLAGGGVRAQRDQRRTPGSGMRLPTIDQPGVGRLEQLERWLKAVARHQPGEDDEALEEVAAWRNADLRALWIDANVLSQVIHGHSASGAFNVRADGDRSGTQIRYTASQLERIAVLACAAAGAISEPRCMAIGAADHLDPDLRRLAALVEAANRHGDDNYLARHGALLHTDIPILAPDAIAAEPYSPAGPQQLRMTISDGRGLDIHQPAVHWELARMLLDFVEPASRSRADSGRDAMVRAWYRATAAWMQLREDHDALHLARARELFPDDPNLLFLSGCQRETYAAPPIQTAVRSAVLPPGVTLGVGSDQMELRQAESFLRRTLEIAPDFAEARMHYGRVLGLLGRHGEAAIALRLVVTELKDVELHYDAELFLGAEEEALGDRAAARAAYERASALAPRAQSPLLALSRLARGAGDRRGAATAMERLFALPDERGEYDDPWWWYTVSQGRDAEALLDAVRRPYLAEHLN